MMGLFKKIYTYKLQVQLFKCKSNITNPAK
jgi:hypothetical protein